MKHKTFIALIAALCLLSSVGPIQVFAEEEDGVSGSVGTSARINIGEKRDERREAIKAKLFSDGPHARFDEKAGGPFMQVVARTEMMSAKLAMFHARLDNILIRIQTNIDTAKNAGKDTSGAQTELDAAKSDLQQAQALMAKVAQARADARVDIKTEIKDNDSDTSLRDIVKETVDEIRPEIKSDMEEIRDLMKSAHLHMIASVKALKSL